MSASASKKGVLHFAFTVRRPKFSDRYFDRCPSKSFHGDRPIAVAPFDSAGLIFAHRFLDGGDKGYNKANFMLGFRA